MRTAVSLSNINLASNNSHYILKDINFEINIGDCVAVLGPNGAGKTTLIKLINNLIQPTSGTVKIFGRKINNAIKKRIGYIPQTNKFDPYLPISVREAVGIGISAKKGILKNFLDKDKSLIENIAKDTKIFHLLNTPVGKLSGGEMQKVSIARVLAQDAKLILLDEPLSNLDKQSQKDILNSIDFSYKQKIRTIIIIIHSLSQIPVCCNKILFLSDGRIIKFGNKNDIFSYKKFQELYGL